MLVAEISETAERIFPKLCMVFRIHIRQRVTGPLFSKRNLEGQEGAMFSKTSLTIFLFVFIKKYIPDPLIALIASALFVSLLASAPLRSRKLTGGMTMNF